MKGLAKKVSFVFAFGVLTLLLPACDEAQQVGKEGVPLREEQLEDYVGETVTVSGEVQEVVSPNVFILDVDEPFTGKNMLVVSRNDIIVDATDIVQVTGMFEDMTVTKAEVDYGFDLDQDWEIKLQDQPILIADVIF